MLCHHSCRLLMHAGHKLERRGPLRSLLPRDMVQFTENALVQQLQSGVSRMQPGFLSLPALGLPCYKIPVHPCKGPNWLKYEGNDSTAEGTKRTMSIHLDLQNLLKL